MFFSIIIPVYNVEDYLEECLNSILIQDFDDYEIICIDDGSTDRSYEILMDYKKHIDKICVLKNEDNNGQSYTRNRGIEKALQSGDDEGYLLFIDSDDTLNQGALKLLAGKVRKQAADIVYYDLSVKDEGQWAKEKNGWNKNMTKTRDSTREKNFLSRCFINTE